jgi:phospholipase/carboxylesterase
MSETKTIVPALLEALDALGFIVRFLDPPEFGHIMATAGTPDATLRAALSDLNKTSHAPDSDGGRLKLASEQALLAFDGLRLALDQGDFRAVFRALRHVPRAHEALYPLASTMPGVNRFFLDPSVRDDDVAEARCMTPARSGDTGVIHIHNAFADRGGYSIYVPETYTPDRSWPLVMALHGGSGHGRGFLWSWVRDARSFGAIAVAPTAIGGTWALMGNDIDTPNLARILASVREHWNIDPRRLLMTGMSDGGTFCYVSGLDSESPFTHLGPVSAAFHPMLAAKADHDRLRGLPMYLVHGALDWMFPVEVAHQAQQALSRAGANVSYREIGDLAHTYPREVNAPMLAWLTETTAPARR